MVATYSGDAGVELPVADEDEEAVDALVPLSDEDAMLCAPLESVWLRVEALVVADVGERSIVPLPSWWVVVVGEVVVVVAARGDGPLPPTVSRISSWMPCARRKEEGEVTS